MHPQLFKCHIITAGATANLKTNIPHHSARADHVRVGTPSRTALPDRLSLGIMLSWVGVHPTIAYEIRRGRCALMDGHRRLRALDGIPSLAIGSPPRPAMIRSERRSPLIPIQTTMARSEPRRRSHMRMRSKTPATHQTLAKALRRGRNRSWPRLHHLVVVVLYFT